MKKITLFILAIGIAVSFSACKKDKDADPVLGCTDSGALNFNPLATSDDGTCVIPEQVQKALVIEFTAAWCGSCGGWGGPTFSALMTNNPGKVVPVAVHTDDDMTPQSLYYGFGPILPDGTFGIPYFRIGDVETYNNSQVTTICAQTPVVAQTALMYTLESGTVNVKTRTKFFTAVTGNYVLAVYVLESGIDGTSGAYTQTGAAAGYKHKCVLRATSTNSAFGETIVTASASAGTTVDKTYNITYTKLSTNSTINIATVIWKKEGSDYKFINGYFK
ncbi:MAG TPA: Omp28-related outer membrane protein [Bacteroidales bacterium]|nr:Omp28-related outer membrane protein [Bacteroidales bacterium]